MTSIPYDYETKHQKEGQSYSRSPLFDGNDYGYWKNRMSTHLLGINSELWEIVEDGFTLVTTTPKAEEIKENKRLKSLDAKARSILYCGLTTSEYNRISSCSTAKQIWDRLEVTYEGTSEVKESRIRLLEQKHHNFKMIPGESINSLFSRFADIANPLKSLGAEIPVKGQISKILFALKGKDWISKRIGIEEGADYKTLTIEGLMGKLKAFEETQQHHEEEDALQVPIPAVEVKKEKSEKSLAFKALKIQEENASEDEESALLSASIKKFIKFNKKGTGNIYGATSNSKGKEKDTVPRCFKCNSKKHMKAYCPVLAKEAEKREDVKKHKDKDASMFATWGESDAEMLSSDEEDNGFKNGVCFMALSDEVNSSQVSF